MVDVELRDELLRRMHLDQEARTAIAPGELLPEGVLNELSTIDADNTSFMKSLVKTQGWPGYDLVGREAARAAWLLVQHADHDPSFQESCLEMLQDAAQAGQADPSDVAYLVDRVRVARDRPQLYGTQYFAQDGVFGPRPIHVPERLDERRASMGLGPHAEYDRLIRATVAQSANDPAGQP